MTPLAQTALEVVPDWLASSDAAPPPDHTDPYLPAPYPSNKEAQRQLTLTQYPIIFERMIERVYAGEYMENFIREDVREFEVESFDQWIKADKGRRDRYKEARKARAHVTISKTIEIADAEDSMEDVQRSKLKIDTRWRQAVADNREYYGDTTKIQMNSTIEVKKSREDTLKELSKLRQAIPLQENAAGIYTPKPKNSDVTDV